jgi:hypothetical protein
MRQILCSRRSDDILVFLYLRQEDIIINFLWYDAEAFSIE